MYVYRPTCAWKSSILFSMIKSAGGTKEAQRKSFLQAYFFVDFLVMITGECMQMMGLYTNGSFYMSIGQGESLCIQQKVNNLSPNN